MKTKILLILLMISLTIIISGCIKETSPSVKSCINEWNAKNLNPGEDFASEQVLVGFVEGVTKIEAKDIINSYTLEIQDWSPPDFTYSKIKVLQGNRDDYIPILENHPRIGTVKLVNDSSDELLIYFYITDFKNLKLEEVESIIDEFDNIELVHDEIYEKFIKINFAVIKVPKNSEFEWICKLQEDSDIKYAEPNYLAQLD